MKIRKKGMMAFSAAAMALLLGLTGCGSSVTDPTTRTTDEPAVSASPELMDKVEAAESASPEIMAKEEQAESASPEMMAKEEGAAADDAGLMSVTYEKNFALMDLSGKTVSLNDYDGKKIYVKFWGTWCSICLAGIDELESFAAEQNGGTDAAVITIVAPGVNGEFNPDDFKDWYEKKGYTFPVLFDDGGKVLQEFGVRAFPTSVIFEKNGRISTIRPGHIENEDLRNLLNKEQ